MPQPPKTEAQGRKRIREAEDERKSKTQKPNNESQSDSLSGLTTFLHHVPAPLDYDNVPTTCSEAVGHEDKPRALILASPCLPQGSVCRAASGSKDEAIYIPSDSESESDGEADDTAPSFRERNTLIDKGTTRQPNSPSPAPTLSTVLNTPRAIGLEIDGDFGDVQHSSPPSLVTSASAPQQRGRVEPPQQTEPHESAIQNAIRILDGEDSYQSRPIMTKPRPEEDVRDRKRTRLAERKDECKSTTKMVDNDNPPDLAHPPYDTAFSNTVVGYDRKTVVPDSTAVSEYDADNSDARTNDVFSHTTRRIYSETEEVQKRDDKLYEKLVYVEGKMASIISTLSKIEDRLEAMHTEMDERFDALRDEIDDLFDARQDQDDN